MMQAGIFTGYFPYGLEGDREENPGARLQHGAARPALQGHRSLDRADHQGEVPSKVRDVFRDHDLPICCISGYTNIIHPDKAERKKRARLSQGDHPPRARLRLALRHFRDRHLQHRISDWVHHPEEQDRGRLRGLPRRSSRDWSQAAYDHGAVFLLETYVNNVVGSVEETVRMFAAGRPSGARPADGSDQLFRGAQHRRDGRRC